MSNQYEPGPHADEPNDADELGDVVADPGIEDPAVDHQTRRSLLIRGTLWQGIGQFVPLVVNLALTPYIIHGLGERIYAIFLLVSVLQAFMSTVDGGIGPSANRYFTLYAGRGDKESTTRLLVTLASIISVLAVIVFGIFYVLAPSIIAFFPETRADPHGAVFFLRTMVVLMAINQVRGLFAFVLFAYHRFGVTTAMGLLGYVIYVAGLVWTIETHHGLVGIAWMFIIQQCIATLFIIPSACRFLTLRGVGLVSRETLSDFFRYSWKAQLSSLLDVTALQSDMLIVQRLRGSQAAAFGPGQTFAQQLRMVPMNAYSPIQSMVGRAVGADGEQGAVTTFERVQRPWVVAVSGWIAVGAPAAYFGVTAWLHTALHGSHLAGLVSSVLLVGNLFYLLALVQIVWCLSVGRSDLELRYGLVALVLNIVGTVALIIPFGVVGSVIATAVSQLIATVYLVRTMRTHLAVSPRSPFDLIPVLPVIVTAAVSFLGTWAMSRLVGGPVPYGPLGLLTCGVGAAPALVLYALWTFGPEQLRTLLATRIPALRR